MSLSNYFVAFCVVGVLSVSAPAWADIPPDDECSEASVGRSCPNAIIGSPPPQLGTCQQTMCTRATPDGAMTYTCYRCIADGTGAGGEGSEGGSSSTAGTAGKSASAGSSSKPSDSSDDGGCSVVQATGAGTLATALLGLGVGLAGILRRRVRKS